MRKAERVGLTVDPGGSPPMRERFPSADIKTFFLTATPEGLGILTGPLQNHSCSLNSAPLLAGIDEPDALSLVPKAIVPPTAVFAIILC